MDEMKQKIRNEVNATGKCIIWVGTLQEYMETSPEMEGEFDFPANS